MKKSYKIFLVILLLGLIFCSNAEVLSVKAQSEVVFDKKTGYFITEDELSEAILVGDITAGMDNYAENIKIIIKNPDSDEILLTIKPKTDYGYYPTLFIGKFTDKKTEQIFISMESGGTGRFGSYYLYDIENKILKTLFDYEKYNNNNIYNVNDKKDYYFVKFYNYYKVGVSNAVKNESFVIDISGRGADYLNQIYNSDGKLKSETFGTVSNVNLIQPVFDVYTKKFNLIAYHRIVGIANADLLGYLVNYIEFSDGKYKITSSNIEIFPN